MRNVIVVWIIEHARTLVVTLKELIHCSCITTKVLFHVGDIIMNFASNLLIAYGFMDLLVSSWMYKFFSKILLMILWFSAPWIFIAIVTLIVSIVLAYDWKHRKILYTHITEPAAPIRSETSDQIANRHKRESTRSSNGYSKGAFVNVEGNNSA